MGCISRGTIEEGSPICVHSFQQVIDLSNSLKCFSSHKLYPAVPPTRVANECIVQKLGKSIDPRCLNSSATLILATLAASFENDMNPIFSKLIPEVTAFFTWAIN